MSLTAETLLASLHEHLAFHTALLPQLHAQLGLPATALATELQELRTVLADAVEERVERRKRDVALWADKCDELERKCQDYSVALGGPSIAGTIKGMKPVNELRKEQNYPKRYELLEKNLALVVRVHSAKLEQLQALHARIRALVSAVGEDFFPPDILEPPGQTPIQLDKNETRLNSNRVSKATARSTRSSILAINGLAPAARPSDLTISALGPVPLTNGTTHTHHSISPGPSAHPPPYDSTLPSPPASDYIPPADVSPAHFARLDRELQRAKLALTERRTELARTLLHASWMMLEMGMELPSEEDGWDDESRDDVTEGDRAFVKFLRGLVDAEAEMEAAGECSGDAEDGMKAAMRAVERLDPKPEIVAWSSELVKALEGEQSHREQRIQDLYNQLAPLWTRLEVPEEEVEAFIERNQGCSERSVLAYEAELKRTKALKSEQMVAFMAHVRTELTQLWDALMMSMEERAEFACFWDDEPSEDLLTRHEDEAARLRGELASKHAILAKAQKWEAIVGEQRALAAAASDQTRLTGRGVRGDPGRLLREEKMRKRVEREKPKLEAELVKELTQWEEERGRPFTMEGVRLLDTINEVRETEAALKEQKKRGRAPTPQGQAPPAAPAAKAPAPRTASRSNQEPPAKKPRLESVGAKATPLGVSKNTARSVSTNKLPGNGRSVSATVPKSPTKTSGTSAEFAVMGMGRSVGSRPRPKQQQQPQPSHQQPDENARKPDESIVRTPVAKAVTGRRQSFRPRPSLDAWVAGAGAGGRLPGMLFQTAEVVVKEEDES
ncbi:Microtubule associated protein (MAP65/ASE1 family) [Rhizoctonia solani]|uniref:Microtubule associated protein (MAP65/ASE1 family) n=1 Tax=Rhizoctonia solani TaxID=456999 RepID=A0A8H7HHX9_9AGAM|nr:Microtubule associated protein (MAP65/ASE1 family) [Rhizoctonia solani]